MTENKEENEGVAGKMSDDRVFVIAFVSVTVDGILEIINPMTDFLHQIVLVAVLLIIVLTYLVYTFRPLTDISKHIEKKKKRRPLEK